MASVQEDGTVRVYRQTPDGKKFLLLTGNPSALAPAGGSPDGALASVSKPDTWIFAASASNPDQILVNDDIIFVTFESVATDGIDVSDCIWNIPIQVSGTPGVKYLSRGMFASPAPADVTATAAVEIGLGGYKVTEGRVRFGGAGIYLDIQDDTA